MCDVVQVALDLGAFADTPHGRDKADRGVRIRHVAQDTGAVQARLLSAAASASSSSGESHARPGSPHVLDTSAGAGRRRTAAHARPGISAPASALTISSRRTRAGRAPPRPARTPLKQYRGQLTFRPASRINRHQICKGRPPDVHRFLAIFWRMGAASRLYWHGPSSTLDECPHELN